MGGGAAEKVGVGCTQADLRRGKRQVVYAEAHEERADSTNAVGGAWVEEDDIF